MMKLNFRLINIILITMVLWIISIYIIKYLHAKTIWKDNTDCMIQYVNNYYPYGSTYLINDKLPHIDARWVWNDYMREIKEIKWCYIKDNFMSTIFNSSYCFITLMFEKWYK